MTTATASAPDTAAPSATRFILIAAGLVAIGFGAAVLLWPTKTAVAVTGVIAVYALAIGLTYVLHGIVSRDIGLGGRIGQVLLGLLYVVGGIVSLGSLQLTAAVLAVFLTVMLGALWIVEGFASLFTIGRAGSKVLTVLFALISVFAGVTLLTSPLWGAVFLWWLLAIALIVQGIVNALRGITGKTA